MSYEKPHFYASETISRTEPLLTLQFGSGCSFFVDRFVYSSVAVHYRDIETISVSYRQKADAGGSPRMQSIGELTIIDKDGKRHILLDLSRSSPGNDSASKALDRFLAMREAAYFCIAKQMSYAFVERILGGETIRMSGMDVSKSRAVRRFPKKAAIFIDRYNYAYSAFDKSEMRQMRIYGKLGNVLYTPPGEDNQLVLPWVLDALFSGNSQ